MTTATTLKLSTTQRAALLSAGPGSLVMTARMSLSTMRGLKRLGLADGCCLTLTGRALVNQWMAA